MASYELMLSENVHRFSLIGTSDEHWQRIIENSKDGVNYALDLIDLRFPGELPADIVAFRVK